MPFCQQCGNEIRESARFCDKCGVGTNQMANQSASTPVGEKPAVGRARGRHYAAFICCVLLIISTFLPWQNLGLFSKRGVDNPDGVILLALAIVAVAIVLYKLITQKDVLAGLGYAGIGILGAIITVVDIRSVYTSGQELAVTLTPLTGNQVDAWSFVGTGLYLSMGASIALIIIGIIAFFKDEAIRPPSWRDSILQAMREPGAPSVTDPETGESPDKTQLFTADQHPQPPTVRFRCPKCSALATTSDMKCPSCGEPFFQMPYSGV